LEKINFINTLINLLIKQNDNYIYKLMCDRSMTFQECELKLLRDAVDKIQQKTGKEQINNPEVKKIIEIVEKFLKDKKRLCYGGTAINNILPKYDQFYDKDIELPDYDFFSPEPLKDAKNLADIYFKQGFEEVEAKAGMHPGTYKVYVNYIPVADITYLVPEIYDNLIEDCIIVDNIYYVPPNYLRMSMYLELSRPKGDVSRWEKVLKRLTLLNKHFPLRGKNCHLEEVQRLFQYGTTNKMNTKKRIEKNNNLSSIEEKIFIIVRDSLISQNCIFFGAFANRLYLKTLPALSKEKIPNIPDFDVLSLNPLKTANALKKKLNEIGIKDIKIVKQPAIGEIIAAHYELFVGNETVAFIYEPLACHSFNTINVAGRKINIATLDTMLSFYLAFTYIKRNYYKANRILCMSEYLFRVQQQNRITRKGINTRFGINCYGEQETIATIRANKTKKYKELKDKKKSKEYEKYFLRYVPYESNSNNKKSPVKKARKKSPKKKTKAKKKKTPVKKNKTKKNKKKTKK